MALKSANGRQTHHTKTGLPVCCEQALTEQRRRTEYGWTGQQSSSGFSDMPRPTLGVFASLDRF
jgi:hypothetical protein